MTGPDLAALREKAEKATPGPWLKGDNYLIGGWWVIAPELPAREDCHRTIVDMVVRREDAVYVAAASPDVILAVLALVDTLQGENQRLRDALAECGGHQDRCATETVWGRGPCNCGWPETLDALSVPPAEKEQP